VSNNLVRCGIDAIQPVITTAWNPNAAKANAEPGTGCSPHLHRCHELIGRWIYPRDAVLGLV